MTLILVEILDPPIIQVTGFFLFLITELIASISLLLMVQQMIFLHTL